MVILTASSQSFHYVPLYSVRSGGANPEQFALIDSACQKYDHPSLHDVHEVSGFVFVQT